MQNDTKIKNPTNYENKQYATFGLDKEKSTIKQTEDGTIVSVPIQSLDMDRDGDKISEAGQTNIIEQLQSGEVAAFPNHGMGPSDAFYDYRDIMGQWVDGRVENGVTMGDLRLREGSELADELLDLLEQDMPVGFSIGFRVHDSEPMEENEGLLIHELDLLEVSPVGIPSNPRSVNHFNNAFDKVAIAAKGYAMRNDGSVEGFEKAFKDALQGDTDMTEETNQEKDTEEKPSTIAELESLKSSLETLRDEIKNAREEYKDVLREAIGVKSPENVDRGDILSYVADHFDGAEITDIENGLPDDAEYIGQMDIASTANLFATAYEVNQGDVMSAMEDFIADLESMAGEEDGDKPEEENEGDEGKNDTPEEESEEQPDEEGDGETEEGDADGGKDANIRDIKTHNETDEDKGSEPNGSTDNITAWSAR